jgi:hypothetical protein
MAYFVWPKDRFPHKYHILSRDKYTVKFRTRRGPVSISLNAYNFQIQTGKWVEYNFCNYYEGLQKVGKHKLP